MLVTPKEMQRLEQLTAAAGISYAEMMERAGSFLAAQIAARYDRRSNICFLAGSGNNGGDCYVAAVHLRQNFSWEGCITVAAPLGAPKTEISAAAKQRADVCVKTDAPPLPSMAEADILVDGLFGTGFRGELPEDIRELLAAWRGAHCVACDIPSGGSGLTGQVSPGTRPAELTVTFGAEKRGMSQYPLRTFCGEIVVGSIGTPEEAYAQVEPVCRLTQEYACTLLPGRRADAHKNEQGHLLCVAGSVRMRGACVLAVTAAMRSGAGLVTCASAEPALTAVCGRVPEAMCLPLQTDAEGFFLDAENRSLLQGALQGKHALLIGCGMGVTEQTRSLLGFLLRESTCPVILDADGLNAAASCIEWIPEGRTVLTPHPGEAARLLGVSTAQVQSDRFAAAQELSRRTGCTVALKGAGTIVTDGSRTAVCNLGNPGMARAGSGDVLAGITASFAAQGLAPFEAACAAVALHAAAGDSAAARLPHRYMLPQDLIASLREVL